MFTSCCWVEKFEDAQDLIGLFGNIHTVLSCVDVLLFQQNLYSLKY